MLELSRSVRLAAVVFLAAGALSCHNLFPAPEASNPVVKPTETPPWVESYHQFFTRDVVRAQREIPFPIILPAYIPKGPGNTLPPEIVGPLRPYQQEGRVEIDILYIIVPGKDNAGTLEITESNFRISPPPPELNPGYAYVQVRGQRMVKMEGNFGPGPGVIFYFDHNTTYLIVKLYNLPSEEAVKVVESMMG